MIFAVSDGSGFLDPAEPNISETYCETPLWRRQSIGEPAPLDAAPQSQTITTSAGIFVQKVEISKGVLHETQHFTLNRLWYPPSDYAALRGLFTKAYQLDRAQIVLKKQPAGAKNL